MQLRSGRRSAGLQRMIRSQVRRAFHGYCRKRTCKKTVMSGRIKAGLVILLNFRRRLIAFVAFRRCRFWCEIGAVRHSSLAGQRIHHASRTVGSNPTLSATPQYSSVSDCSNRQQNERAARQTLLPPVLRCYPLVTAQTVASRRGFGGCILRGRTHGRQAQAARRRTQNSVRQILPFMVALRREPMSPTGLGFAEWAVMETD
jgi:hypothetical protein